MANIAQRTISPRQRHFKHASLIFLALPALLVLSTATPSPSLSSIDHVIFLVQSGRSFNHYYGTLPGVRGFSDPQAPPYSSTKDQEEHSTLSQPVPVALSNATDYLLPWHLNYLGEEWNDRTQCLVPGDDTWLAKHDALDEGRNDAWVSRQGPESWGYFKRQDIPLHYAIADSWVIGDAYHETLLVPATASSNEKAQASTTLETGLQQVQRMADFNDVAMGVYATSDSAHQLSSYTFLSSIDAFFDDMTEDKLPMITYLIAPAWQSEQPPHTPNAGAELQDEVISKLVHSPAWEKSALFITYETSGGWGDHVTPPDSLLTKEESLSEGGKSQTTPGMRVPFHIISPWTRGAHTFTEVADHRSQTLFLNKWMTAKGYKRQHDHDGTTILPGSGQEVSDLTNAFDFSSSTPAYSSNMSSHLLTACSTPACPKNATHPTPPYTSQPSSPTALSETGSRSLRGKLTPGRTLVLEADTNDGCLALTNNWMVVSFTICWNGRALRSQHWLAWPVEGEDEVFVLQSGLDGKYIGEGMTLVEEKERAVGASVRFMGEGRGYEVSLGGRAAGVIQESGSQRIMSGGDALVAMKTLGQAKGGFKIYAVT